MNAGPEAENARPLRIGNASGFYGDRFSAWREMLDGGNLDVLTGDYLAELTMLILGRDRFANPDRGYAKTFLRQLEGCLGTALEKGVKIVTNAGGVNPAGLAQAVRDLGSTLGLSPSVAYVKGDDLLGHPGVPDNALTSNAYLGAFGIAECLRADADIVVTGRVTDASLVVGPAIAWFGWSRTDLNALAGATVAGHLLECGPQVTGGNFSFFTDLPDGGRHPGFPIAELHSTGSAVITKHLDTGGAVTVETVTAQLLYEIEGVDYLGPDVVAHFDGLRLDQEAPDRVRISGVRGSPPPATAKVGVTALGGYRNAVTFVLCGPAVEEKAALVRDQLTTALGKDLEFRLARTDRPDASTPEQASALLHVHVRDPDPRRAGRAFSAAAVELALASYPGCTLTAPPTGGMPYGVFSAHAVPQHAVPHTAVLPDGRELPIPPPDTFGPTTGDGAGAGADDNAGDTEDVGAGGPTRALPLGTVVGARSGDKGADATLGVWARTDATYRWLRRYLSVDRLRQLLPEVEPLLIERYELPNLRAVGFTLRGLLGEGGVAASTRFDPQAKALGEWLRSRHVDIPEALL